MINNIEEVRTLIWFEKLGGRLVIHVSTIALPEVEISDVWSMHTKEVPNSSRIGIARGEGSTAK
jgi:hypothetical protein